MIQLKIQFVLYMQCTIIQIILINKNCKDASSRPRRSSAQLKGPRSQMRTLLDRSSVIFKFPPLRFNFYQGPAEGATCRAKYFPPQFFSLRWHLPASPRTHFFIIKIRSGVAEPALPTRAVITKQSQAANIATLLIFSLFIVDIFISLSFIQINIFIKNL